MSSPLDPLLEALANYWWGRLVNAAFLFAFAAFLGFVIPKGRFDACGIGMAAVAAGLATFFLVTGLRNRGRRGS